VQGALWRADDSKLSVEQLTALSRAVPEDHERRDLALFLKVLSAPAASSLPLSQIIAIQGHFCHRFLSLSHHLISIKAAHHV
jgi:hypothetical protein